MQIANFAQDEIEETFARIDENGDRRISFGEFARLMLEMDMPGRNPRCTPASMQSTRITTAT